MNDYDAGVRKLEEELATSRAHGARALRELHARMAKELRTTRRQLKRARQRARAAEEELALLKASSTPRGSFLGRRP